MNDPLTSLLQRYAAQGLVKADELLLMPADALKLADELQANDIGVLGVDTWYLSAGKLAESLDGIDTSALLDQVNGRERSVAAAITFIRDHLSPHIAYVSFVFE